MEEEWGYIDPSTFPPYKEEVTEEMIDRGFIITEEVLYVRKYMGGRLLVGTVNRRLIVDGLEFRDGSLYVVHVSTSVMLTDFYI